MPYNGRRRTADGTARSAHKLPCILSAARNVQWQTADGSMSSEERAVTHVAPEARREALAGIVVWYGTYWYTMGIAIMMINLL